MISTYPTSKRIILCIADDQAILRYEQALLERSGYAVLTAASAQQALRLVTMCKCDAVLLRLRDARAERIGSRFPNKVREPGRDNHTAFR